MLPKTHACTEYNIKILSFAINTCVSESNARESKGTTKVVTMVYLNFITKATYHIDIVPDSYNAKQKHPGCKKGARPIRSSPPYVRPKSLLSAEDKKSPI